MISYIYFVVLTVIVGGEVKRGFKKDRVVIKLNFA